MNTTHPFDYDLNLFTLPGSGERTLICLHGSGANYEIAKTIRSWDLTEATLISFNFPDYDLILRTSSVTGLHFGTIAELLPVLYVLKICIIDQKLDKVDLYGFSAGGGALTNAIGVLNRTTYDQQLLKIGIGSVEKAKILSVIQMGSVLLDCPLKSVEEIIDLRGSTPELQVAAVNYNQNLLRPIDALEFLKGLSLQVILYFEQPDEIIFNRDDTLYAQRLESANSKGKTFAITGNTGGHMAPHYPLWELYR